MIQWGLNEIWGNAVAKSEINEKRREEDAGKNRIDKLAIQVRGGLAETCTVRKEGTRLVNVQDGFR